MKVYKYRGVESDIFKRDLKTFKKNQFFAPKFEMLNDPFEANFKENLSNLFDLLNSFVSIGIKELKQQLQEVIDYKHKLGILSLSKTCYSEQMWAYYASSHKGYCIEYDLEKLKVKTKDSDYSNQLEISYTDDIPTLGIEDLDNNLMLQKMYGIKKEKWKHEQEIRLIFNSSSLKNHHESAITGVYFGYLASKRLIEVFKEAFKDRDIKFYQITVNTHKNQLEEKLHFEFQKQRKFDISKYDFEILKYQNSTSLDNYYIYLKDTLNKNDLKKFVFAFRERFCYKPNNINIFNTDKISDLIGVYPLKGADYIRYADAFIAAAYFSPEDFIHEYPYKDFYYKEQLDEISKF
ncbi:DUF2971 domain-containing protein [Runella aurantiaca]|uniref:DUF2971 domain-containing protein n=1 Tax=Runella aurantiaca TaxID=2282308 RepID=A0A369IIR2_9BACT|nr:DUF2971 domain-containing protein [Runella aurantiaca]RDB06536.1 DUF2971 domain-containing protein [Runella aurantiaca]